MAWINLVDYYIAGVAEKLLIFSVPVLFDGHDSRAKDRLAIDYSVPLPDLPGGVTIKLVALIRYSTRDIVNQIVFVSTSMELSQDFIQSPPSTWESTQISLAYQLVDAFSLNLRTNYDNPQFEIIKDNRGALAPNMKRVYLE